MSDLIRIPFPTMWQAFTRVLRAQGLDESRAGRCAQIFAENTRDGVMSHGLNRFPAFVRDIKAGVIHIEAEPERVRSLGVLEQWDGKRGVGPLNAEMAMQRAIRLAHAEGLGCVGLRNTNHWMRAGTYGLLAAAADCVGICWTNTVALMPPWGAGEKKIGNNPLVVCVPRKEGPVLLDMAMSQFSNGKLEVLCRRDEQLPLAGGYDKNGALTCRPGDILESQRALPIGYWKGSGLALVLDLMAALIADGDATRDISQRDQETGVSQVFMAVRVPVQGDAGGVEARVNAIIEDFLDVPPLRGIAPVRYPGQGMLAARKENLANGIPVDPKLWQSVLAMERGAGDGAVARGPA